MLNNFYTIKAIAQNLNKEISGYLVKEIFTQEKNKLLIEIFKEETSYNKVLEFSIERNYNYLLIKNNYTKAKKNYANLFEEVSGNEILRIELFNEDRIISITLDDDCKLIFTFFSNEANCFAIKNYKIVNAFKNKDSYILKDISKVIPAKKNITSAIFENITTENYLKAFYPEFGKLYRKEILWRAGVDGNKMNNEILKKKLDEEAELTNKELNSPCFLFYNSNDDFTISLIELKHTKSKFERYDNVNNLISDFLKLRQTKEKINSIREKKIKEYESGIENIKKKIKSLETQILHSDDSQKYRIYGDILLQNIDSIRKGDLRFLFDLNGNLTEIKLKENLTPSENARFYYEKYKKQKGSADILKQKIILYKKQKINLESELGKFLQLKEYKTLIREEKKMEKESHDETSRFRKFTLNEKYEVWVGKDSVTNDMLTTKYASPNDLWFHVRGASGSHTVLKVSNKKEVTGKEIINKAASIAAYYSKARNASSVPVAYCQKKYVKKKKGFKEGSVVMEREKVIFVKPGLPAISN